jgi:cardiolipin synthase
MSDSADTRDSTGTRRDGSGPGGRRASDRQPGGPTAPPVPPRITAGLKRHGLVRRPDEIAEILRRRGLRFSEGNAVELFDCGRAAFPAMLEAIRGARDFVHLETYLLRADRIGSRFLEALTERAASGVEVRVLYDAVGSYGLDPNALEPLRRAGAQVVVFNPIRRFYPRWAPRRRDHRKLLIVDGEIGFTGGLNVGDEYDAGVVAGPGDAGWRDSHVRVRGPATRDLGAVFLESWFRAGGTDLPWDSLLQAPAETCGSERCGVLPDGPVYLRRAMRDLLVSALGGAKRSARLTSPYFAPDHGVLEALEHAAERGVRVELVLAGHTDHPLMRRGARSTLERLLERGVQVHEYTAARLHAKTAVFDGSYGIVGTSNLDRQSFQHNYEVNLVVDGSLPERLDGLFEADLARSIELTLERLARRGRMTKLFDRLAAAVVQGFV